MTKWIRNAKKDVPDLRDRMYEPSLDRLEPCINPEVKPEQILNQGSEGACTGFALAAVINHLKVRAGDKKKRVSPRMLYEMAKLFDEWEGVDYEGSSIRGAIRGWKNNGVCLDGSWRYKEGRPGRLTITRAKEAREHTVGAYYRVRPEISDFHSALNEAGVIAASANVHTGWDRPGETIEFHKERDGGHAFAIVGYNHVGFWIQNSWGPRWGASGLALWTYEDWAYNLMDAWVVQMALPTPQIFGVQPRAAIFEEGASESKASVPRAEIAGHFVHIDDGEYKEKGRYWSTEADVRHTAELVAGSKKYDHVLVYAHGGLNSPAASARRVRAMRDGFKRNRIYPYHVMYDTGLGEELKDIILQKGAAAQRRVGGLTDWLDEAIEAMARPLGTRLWDEMKKDARVAFEPEKAGTTTLGHFHSEMVKPGASRKQIHIVGHSTGGVLLAHLLHALRDVSLHIKTCTLLAPACSVELYDERYIPPLKRKSRLQLDSLSVLNLNERLELDDNVATIYRKSLLYLVSNAFERAYGKPQLGMRKLRNKTDLDEGKPLLGMRRFKDDIDLVEGKTELHFSNGSSGRVTRSRTHGGFDNDVTTMNYVLQRILGHTAQEPFTKEELEY